MIAASFSSQLTFCSPQLFLLLFVWGHWSLLCNTEPDTSESDFHTHVNLILPSWAVTFPADLLGTHFFSISQLATVLSWFSFLFFLLPFKWCYFCNFNYNQQHVLSAGLVNFKQDRNSSVLSVLIFLKAEVGPQWEREKEREIEGERGRNSLLWRHPAPFSLSILWGMRRLAVWRWLMLPVNMAITI